MTLRHFLSSRRWRLASGIVLFAYLVTHFFNHMLGLLTLEAAEAGLTWSIAFWHSWPGTILLYGAATLHFSLALTTLYMRREWKLPAIEYLRLWAGFSLPLLLIGHAATARLGVSLHETVPTYANTVANIISGGTQEKQLALLAPGWVHGGLGLWISLRRSALMRRLKFLLLGVLVCVPLLSAAGFINMGRELVHRGLATPPAAATRYIAAAPVKGPAPHFDAARAARAEELRRWKDGLTNAYLALIAAALLIGPLRRAAVRRIAPL